MCQRVKDGGMGLLDLERMIHVSRVNWVKRLCINDYDSWTFYPRAILEAECLLYDIFATKNRKSGKGIVNAFYRDMWLAWNTFYNKDPVTDKEIENESLWNNERILIGKRVMY